MSYYIGLSNFSTTYPYAAGLYSWESQIGPVYPVGDLERVTEDTIQRITEDGKTRLTE